MKPFILEFILSACFVQNSSSNYSPNKLNSDFEDESIDSADKELLKEESDLDNGDTIIDNF